MMFIFSYTLQPHMMSIRRIIFILFVLTITEIKCAKILVYIATPSISHQVVFRPLTQALASRGHEVVVVTTDPAYPKGLSPVNLTEINVHDVSYDNWEEMYELHTGNKQDLLQEIKLMFKKYAIIFDRQLQTPGVKTNIMNKKKDYFDIILIEAWNRLTLGFTHKFDAPVIQVSSLGAVPVQYAVLGAPTNPFLYPTPGRQRLYNLSLTEKCLEIVKLFMLDTLTAGTEAFDIKILQKHFGEDIKDFEQLSKRIDMLFLNEHRIWADNRPVPPGIIYLGGIHQTVEKDLPTDLKNYVDQSKHGVIYVSFGTNVLPSQLSPEKIQIMTKVFSELPYDVLWKYDRDVLQGQSNNIKIYKWFPQADLLKHQNIKLFITQGGMQSTDEAIDAAVPLIGIPLSSDQWYNVEKYVYHKIGLQLDLPTITETEFKESIVKVIEDQSFKNNILKLRTLMREYPIKPLELAVWWTEHLIKYGASHIKAPAARMFWIEYYEVKLVLIVLSVMVICILLTGLFLRSLFKFILDIFSKNIKIKKL